MGTDVDKFKQFRKELNEYYEGDFLLYLDRNSGVPDTGSPDLDEALNELYELYISVYRVYSELDESLQG